MNDEAISREVVCATTDCDNEGEPILLELPPDIAAVMCGACGQPITDITPPLTLIPAV